MDEVNSNNCEICFTNLFKYKCPKCNLNYCSMTCYKSEKHINCTEQFYRECCMSELEGVHVSKDMREKMEDILASSSNILPTNNNVQESLEDRLCDLALDDTDEIWERLNDQERKEFFKFIESDELKKYVKCWKPWWIFEMVEEIDDKTVLRCPKIYKNIIAIDKLVSKSPNKSIRYTIMHILLCYSYIARRYNGDHHSFHDEISEIYPEICPVLFSSNAGISFTSMEDVVGSFVFNASNSKVQLNNEFLMLIIDDLFYFLKAENTGRGFIAAALSDVRTILKGFPDYVKPICKKLEFFISWITTSKTFQGLMEELTDELEIAKMVNLTLK